MARLTGGDGAKLPEGRRVIASIQGGAVPQEFMPKMIGWWREGRFPIERLVTIYDFADINRAVADVEDGLTVKAVLRMPAEE